MHMLETRAKVIRFININITMDIHTRTHVP
jgi:hypothetical protein